MKKVNVYIAIPSSYWDANNTNFSKQNLMQADQIDFEDYTRNIISAFIESVKENYPEGCNISGLTLNEESVDIATPYEKAIQQADVVVGVYTLFGKKGSEKKRLAANVNTIMHAAFAAGKKCFLASPAEESYLKSQLIPLSHETFATYLPLTQAETEANISEHTARLIQGYIRQKG